MQQSYKQLSILHKYFSEYFIGNSFFLTKNLSFYAICKRDRLAFPICCLA